MTAWELLAYLVLGLVCGVLGQMLAGRSLGGWPVSTVLGIVGAFVGGAIARRLDLPEPLPVTIGGRTIPLIWAVVGAALIALAIALFDRITSPPARSRR